MFPLIFLTFRHPWSNSYVKSSFMHLYMGTLCTNTTKLSMTLVLVQCFLGGDHSKMGPSIAMNIQSENGYMHAVYTKHHNNFNSYKNNENGFLSSIVLEESNMEQ